MKLFRRNISRVTIKNQAGKAFCQEGLVSFLCACSGLLWKGHVEKIMNKIINNFFKRPLIENVKQRMGLFRYLAWIPAFFGRYLGGDIIDIKFSFSVLFQKKKK